MMYAVSLKQTKKKSKRKTTLTPVCFITHQQEPQKIVGLEKGLGEEGGLPITKCQSDTGLAPAW
jgi:hypothetical protein